ncbi:MAG: hypothetical protein Q9188_004537 [Gyalolechia gomerana]
MLFQFHQDQNAKEPGSVCAVYLLSGLWAPASPTASAPNLPGDGEDAYMRSNPFMSSSMPHKEEGEEPQAVRSVVMCREEDLKGRSVMTASAPPNLHILADCNRKTYEKNAMEDPLKVGQQYGTIQNAQVRRRTGPKPIVAAVPKTEGSSAKLPDPKASQWRTSDQADTKPKNQPSRQNIQEKKIVSRAPSLKRDQSDIFKSFAKPRAQISRENTDSSAGASPAPQPCPTLLTAVGTVNDGSESEGMDDFPASNEGADKLGRTTRSEREENLRNLMNDDDDNQTTEPIKTEADERAPVEIAKEQPQEELAASTMAGGGRRRGRRKVMKKKMLKDEEGYLGSFAFESTKGVPIHSHL